MNRYATLDGWRGICALLVALFHLSAGSHLFYMPLIRNAGMFVDFFFVLSGFVLAFAYSTRIESRADLGIYILRRLGRLWPLHIFILLLFIFLEAAKYAAITYLNLSAGESPFSGTTDPYAIFSNVFLIHSLGLHATETWNGPSWSISTEFWVNVVFGVLALTARNRIVVWSCLAILASSLALMLFNDGRMGATYDYGIFRCLYGFFAGVLTYILHGKLREAPIRFPNLLEIATLAAVILYASFVRYLPTAMFTPLVFGVAVLVFAGEKGSVSKLIGKLPFQLLGRWSYSIYMVHFLVLAIFWGGARAIQQLLNIEILTSHTYLGQTYEMLIFGNLWIMDAFSIGYLATVIGISSLTFRFVEEPCRIYVNEMSRRIKRAAPVRVTGGSA